jgi:hypothetical protein
MDSNIWTTFADLQAFETYEWGDSYEEIKQFTGSWL